MPHTSLNISFFSSHTAITPDQLKSLHEVLEGGVASVNAYWTIYSTVALAILGYVFAAKEAIQFRAVRLILASVFAVFAFCNWHAMSKQQNKLVALSQYVISKLDTLAETKPLALAYKNNIPANSISLLHICLDISVVTLVLVAPAIKQAKLNTGNG
ncbi:MAG: hypothetical protein JWL59_3793 [Chthoniobacteraceae bacterium]|nr:hypothetical protein [Chthoniobacteraceae bacterium]